VHEHVLSGLKRFFEQNQIPPVFLKNLHVGDVALQTQAKRIFDSLANFELQADVGKFHVWGMNLHMQSSRQQNDSKPQTKDNFLVHNSSQSFVYKQMNALFVWDFVYPKEETPILVKFDCISIKFSHAVTVATASLAGVKCQLDSFLLEKCHLLI